MQSLKRWFWPIIVAAAVVSLFANRGFRRLFANELALRRLNHKLDALQKEEGDLHTQIQKLKKDDVTLETAARKDLGYLKPGELEYRFPPPKP